jgi:hypothetical protein
MMFHDGLRLGVPLDSERAVLVGRFFASVNIAACVLQIVIMPSVLSQSTLPQVLSAIPLIVLAIVVCGFVYPCLLSVMVAFGALKVLGTWRVPPQAAHPPRAPTRARPGPARQSAVAPPPSDGAAPSTSPSMEVALCCPASYSRSPADWRPGRRSSGAYTESEARRARTGPRAASSRRGRILAPRHLWGRGRRGEHLHAERPAAAEVECWHHVT